MRRLAVTTALVLLALAAPAAAQDAHSPNLTHVKTLPYEARNGTTPNYGTDIEFARIGDRQYALAGSYRNGLQIVDITDPEQARIAAVYDCGDHPGRPAGLHARGAHVRDATRRTPSATARRPATARPRRSASRSLKADGTGRNGTFIADITDPLAPRTVSFVHVEQGSHNQTVHPSGNFLYNSNSDLITSYEPAIEVFDISDFAAPRKVGELALPLRPGLGTESHDITFNEAGDRAYSAALSQGVIIDTSDPARAEHRHQLPRPGDQRLAPVRPVHAHRRDRAAARVPDRRGRGRGRDRHRPVPERRRPRLRHHRRQRAEPGQGRLLEHRRGAADHRARPTRARPTSSTSTRTRRS